MAKCYAKMLINTALEEVGYHEKKTNNNLEDKIANSGSNNWNRYASYIDNNYPDFYNARKNGYAWCDIFVDCMFLWTYGLEDTLRLTCQPLKSLGASCTSSYNYYKAKGQISNNPAIGAQIFFAKNGAIYHTGIVVDFDEQTVTTVEGNSGDSVQKKKYLRTLNTIYGYGIPKYDVPVKSNEDIADEVIAGRWGSGEQRKQLLTSAGYDYEIIQKIVNEKLQKVDVLELEVDRKKYNKILIKLVN